MRVSLTIENTYEDGDEVVVLKDEEIEDPPTPVVDCDYCRED